MHKILFVASGNIKDGISPIQLNQGSSLEKIGNRIDYFPIKGKGCRGYLRAIIKLRKELKKISVDVIHAHYGLCGIVALLARRKERIVISFMGDDIIGTNKPNGSVYLVSKAFARFNIFLARYFYNYSIAKSPEMLKKIALKKKAILIPNGVDINKFKPEIQDVASEKTGFAPNKKHVIFVSNPTRVEKNFALAQKACEMIADPLLELHHITDVAHDLLPVYYNTANLLLLTSFHEGSPNVIKEAMACNCPIVATDVGDVKWLFGDTPGHYITSFEPTDVAKKIKLALQFHNEHGQTRGRERIIALGLDSETVAKRIVEVYKKVLDGNKATE